MIWRCPEAADPVERPALFLDRDGVVIVDQNYLGDPEGVELVPGAATAMVRAASAGYLLIGLSNQSGLGRGRFGPEQLAAVMARVDLVLSAFGAAFDAVYYCPHAPHDGCRCRKPGPGLLEEAALSFRWNPSRSWVIGDKSSDVALGRRHGLGGVLVATGHGAEHADQVRAQYAGDARVLLAADLSAAVDRILDPGPGRAPEAGGA